MGNLDLPMILMWLFTGFKADIYPDAEDPLHQWAFQNKKRIDLGSELQAWLAPPEYVIIRKLEYFREGRRDKHLRDIRFMLACTEVDRVFLDAQIARLGLREGRLSEAHEGLRQTVERFTEGFGTTDFKTATRLLAQLNSV